MSKIKRYIVAFDALHQATVTLPIKSRTLGLRIYMDHPADPPAITTPAIGIIAQVDLTPGEPTYSRHFEMVAADAELPLNYHKYVATLPMPAGLMHIIETQSGTQPGLSPDGTVLAVGDAGSLTTTSGIWTFGPNAVLDGNDILLNGLLADNGHGVFMEVANGGRMYLQNTRGVWLVWDGTSWSELSGLPAQEAQNTAEWMRRRAEHMPTQPSRAKPHR